MQKGGKVLPENIREQKEAFVKLPKKFLSNEKNNKLSPISVMVYSFLADRASLSLANGWTDENGRVFIYFAVNEMAKVIGCGRNKIMKCYKELEKEGLIERKRQGQGKASVIYVNPVPHSDFKKSHNETSGSPEMKLLEVSDSNPNNTYINKTELSKNYLSVSKQEYDETRMSVEEQVGYEFLCEIHDKKVVDELIMLITDTLCSNDETIHIAGQLMQKSVVVSRFRKLNEEHIGYVINCFKNTKKEITNIRSYMLTSLYNAPTSTEFYYQSLYNFHQNSG